MRNIRNTMKDNEKTIKNSKRKQNGITHSGNYRNSLAGSKAANLFRLFEQGIPVPEFFCISRDTKKQEMKEYLADHFSETKHFSVRSAARVEDGNRFSYAGQFRTRLFVLPDDCWEAAQDIFLEEERARNYQKSHNIRENVPIEMTVIIQEMIDSELSGVMFTANPQGILNELVIAVGRGTGDRIVEDKTPVTTYYFNRTDRVFYYEKDGDSPLLEESLLFSLADYGERIEALFGTFQDIEFAVKNQKFWFLQARPITSLSENGRQVILDNSNIVESYPGISLPATQSFVREIYGSVFKSCLFRLCRDKKAVCERDALLQNMVGTWNGRIYYQISNWYEILRFLPFSGKIIPIWQEMLGVRDRQVSEGLYPKPGIRLKGRVALSFVTLLLSSPRKMEALNRYFRGVIKTVDLNSCQTPEELLRLYHRLKEQLSSKWDITLVNDMYTFLYTALLRKAAGSGRADRILSKITGLESMKPVHAMMKIAGFVRERHLEGELRQLKTKAEACQYLKEDGALAELLRRYINLYGDRSLEELKLESETFRTNPLLLIQMILTYAKKDITRKKCERNKRRKTLKSKKLTAGGDSCCRSFCIISECASKGIRYREISRMNRSRIFGIVREILLRVAEELRQRSLIEEENDIFYLYFQEIEDAVKMGTSCKKLIQERKREYESYRKLPAFSRLVFEAEAFEQRAPKQNRFGQKGVRRNSSIESGVCLEQNDGPLYGTPCSGGISEGEVLVVTDPFSAGDVSGKILVAEMTDPGWVFLIAKAKALIVEKGSLLSHTAIVTRELGRPSVVGVQKAQENLKNGDLVRVNGTTGEITVLKRAAYF